MLTACRSYHLEYKENLYKITVRRSPLVGMAQRVHISVRDAAREIVRDYIDIPPTLTIQPEFPACAIVTRDLGLDAKLLERETGQTVADPAKLTAPMVERLLGADQGFAILRRSQADANSPPRKKDYRKQHLAE